MAAQVSGKFTIVSFGYIAGVAAGGTAAGGSGAPLPDWIYHTFDRRFSANITSSAACSVELLALETFTGRTVTNISGGSTLDVPFTARGSGTDSGNGDAQEVGEGGSTSTRSMKFLCMHYNTQHFVRIPSSMGKRVPHNMPFWCLPPLSLSGDTEEEKALHAQRVTQACNALRTQDLYLELFVPARNAQPKLDVTTHFTTTMGSYPMASRPDLSNDIAIHAVMPYHRVDRFNKVVFHMWLSYHALMGFHVVSSIPNIAFYEELPRHVAKHPNIAHYDSSILKAVQMDCSSQYNNPYVVEFEKMMLATFVRFEYRVLYGTRFVVNADPDEFVMAPHGPGFDYFHFSPFKNYSESARDCDVDMTKNAAKPSHAVKQNADLFASFLAAMNMDSNQSDTTQIRSVAPVAVVATDKTNFVPLSLTNWRWTASDIVGIKKQAKYINWVVNEVFALTVTPHSTQSNLYDFRGKAMEVVLHKEYVSTENTTSKCLAEMLNSTQNDVYTFSKCFDYLSVMHPGTNKFDSVRSKYLNINQACVSDTIHHSCVRNNNHKYVRDFLSSSVHCMCHKVDAQPYLFLLHFRENGKSGGHSLHQITCSIEDHEDSINSQFLKHTTPRLPYNHEMAN